MGGCIALCFFAPVFLLISLVIKISSKGPVFFRQQRIGQHGGAFHFLEIQNDASLIMTPGYTGNMFES